MSGYTIEADVMATQAGTADAGDLGLINQGYTLDLMGKKQKLQLRTWASELEKSATVAFAAEPDVWYHMKLRVDVGGRQGHRPRQGLEEGRARSPRTGRSRSRTRSRCAQAPPGSTATPRPTSTGTTSTVKVSE